MVIDFHGKYNLFMDIRAALHSQFHAALSMLAESVEKCPDSEWTSERYTSPTWRIAYHALFYTHLYLQKNIGEFHAWIGHREKAEDLSVPLETSQAKGVDIEPFTRQEIREYLAFLRTEVDARLSEVNLEGPSGFDWLPFSKLELQVYNLRHLQQHVGEIDQRLGEAGMEVHWIGSGN